MRFMARSLETAETQALRSMITINQYIYIIAVISISITIIATEKLLLLLLLRLGLLASANTL